MNDLLRRVLWLLAFLLAIPGIALGLLLLYGLLVYPLALVLGFVAARSSTAMGIALGLFVGCVGLLVFTFILTLPMADESPGPSEVIGILFFGVSSLLGLAVAFKIGALANALAFGPASESDSIAQRSE